MSTTSFTTRLFGGHDLGVTYDSGAGTISILGQSVTISSLSAALQAQWSSAVGSVSSGNSRGTFGGDNIGQAVGNILDAQATWRSAVRAALTGYLAGQTTAGAGGNFAGVETFNR